MVRWSGIWKRGQSLDNGKPGPKDSPVHRLLPEERTAVTAFAVEERYADLSHRILAVTAWDLGVFFVSFSSVYRILRSEGLMSMRGPLRHHNGRSVPPTRKEISGANQRWCWESHASAKSKQEFIAKYAGTEEAAKVSKDLEGMAIVDLEYPKSITQTGGSSGNPVWNFCIVFHERNGVAARINCTSLGGRNLQQTWWHPSPIKGNIHLPAKGTRSYCSWVSGGSLRGSSTSVSFSIVDENGHSSSAWASFILE